jgi:hypothetical protein
MARKTKQKAQNRKVKSAKRVAGKAPKVKGKGSSTRKPASQSSGRTKQAEESGTGPKSQSSRTDTTLGRMTKAMSRAQSLRELQKMAKNARSTAGIGGSRGRNSHWGKAISKAFTKREKQLRAKLERAKGGGGGGGKKRGGKPGRSSRRTRRRGG